MLNQARGSIVVTTDQVDTLDNDDSEIATSGITAIKEGMTTEPTADERKEPGDLDVTPALSETMPLQPVPSKTTPAAIA